jgi:hypothetical protein
MPRTSTLLFVSLLALAAGAEPTVPRDLLAVLTLKGKPCGSITATDRKGESDYFVTCSDGHHYHVFIGPGDRVVVEDK